MKTIDMQYSRYGYSICFLNASGAVSVNGCTGGDSCQEGFDSLAALILEHAGLAHSGERQSCKLEAVGAEPTTGSKQNSMVHKAKAAAII